MTQYSTQHYIVSTPPKLNCTSVCGKYLQLPVLEKYDRQAEGGLRCNNQFKKSTSDLPLISVCTTVRNAKHSIERCIRSVLEQDYQNIEYIIVDAHSEDGTLEFIKKYEDAIDYFVSEKDENLADGLNKCLSLASGDWIIEICADNYFLPNVFQAYVDLIQEEHTSVVYAYQYITDKKGNINCVSSDTFDTVFFNSVAHETILIKKDLMNKIGYYDIHNPMSITPDFILKIYFNTEKASIKLIPKPVLVYFVEGIGKQNIEVNLQGKIELMYKSFGEKLNITREQLGELVWFKTTGYNTYSMMTVPQKLEFIESQLKKFFQLEYPKEWAWLYVDFMRQVFLHFDYFNLQARLRKRYISTPKILWSKFTSILKRMYSGMGSQ